MCIFPSSTQFLEKLKCIIYPTTLLLVSLKQIGILLEHIVKERNGGNVDDFVKLVRENQTILRDMKVCYLPSIYLGIVFIREDIIYSVLEGNSIISRPHVACATHRPVDKQKQ